ncbi:hypothetical protein LIT13_06725 [Flavobacterium psychrophilum]|uniref:hypothetical protein n=1 Tax=Flavobacterium phage Fpv7 TaxID=1814287 RepID=UPI00078D1215|nr:hypothetical protein [Flavobacterium psychrophilum]YP_009321208.1 hypothetical protein BOW77_gp03 [Flavobacterium phage Fpv7]YP_009322274.1 hypothetical protein BOW76_gp03 [Flavobacterium phage Fpv8]YP_009322380.1 hypothetical protein BOW79_gp03 [Flavobacterium phage Fpv5]YP_009323674.1 hypothetical protein BOW72_gp03 [Flavobacterium phage Fpv10]YP_009324526.1 hypothetical protein BOW78_gp03 [Flavobacterium phage Fpv6]YP_009325214.1 hypothetical protein BOW83_gp03 [Flavobacterium phage Fpv
MFKSTILVPAYKNLIGWREHFNPSEISIDAALQITESGEYFQDKHPALRLDYIQTTLSKNQDLNVYLAEKIEVATNGIFNDIIQYRQVANYGKTLLEQAQLLNRHSWAGDKIVNQNRFVGFQIHVKALTGLQTIINEIGLQLDAAQTLKLYLFHSQKEDAIDTFELTTTDTSWKWKKIDFELNSIAPELFHGGVFVLGYYQEDLTASAINYSNFNWDKGECGSCNNNFYSVWKSIRDHFHVYPIYVPQMNFTKEKMFDLEKANYCNDTSWGLNLKFTVRCDLTNFFLQNKFAFKNLLSLKVAHLILNDMKFSQETNYVEENLKNMVIRDLEGDKETNALNISQLYNRELKAVNFNISEINNRCLGCEADTFQPNIGYV